MARARRLPLLVEAGPGPILLARRSTSTERKPRPGWISRRPGSASAEAVVGNERSAPLFHADSGTKRFPKGHFLGGQRAPAVWLQGSASFDLNRRSAALHATGWFCVFILSKSLLLLLPATARASCSAQDVFPTPPGAISAPTVFGKKPGKI